MLVVLKKVVAFNAWKAKMDNMISKTSVLCGKAKESMSCRFCECMQAQKAWEFIHLITNALEPKHFCYWGANEGFTKMQGSSYYWVA